MYILLQNYKKTDMRALSLCFFLKNLMISMVFGDKLLSSQRINKSRRYNGQDFSL